MIGRVNLIAMQVPWPCVLMWDSNISNLFQEARIFHLVLKGASNCKPLAFHFVVCLWQVMETHNIPKLEIR
jgi:hypothetical protein